jgi:DNA-nicking Smr family endonuclease
VTRTVRPLARAAAHEPRPARLHVTAAPVAPRVVLPAHPAPAPTTRAAPSKHAPLADRSPEKRVRRGKLDVAARLDMHGMTQAEALQALGGFLAHHRADGARCVLVVTGKGRDGAGGVLKQKLPDWLGGGSLRAIVSGYAVAHQKHGGGGAYYVFLKARGG